MAEAASRAARRRLPYIPKQPRHVTSGKQLLRFEAGVCGRGALCSWEGGDKPVFVVVSFLFSVQFTVCQFSGRMKESFVR